MDRHGLEVLSRERCLELLREVPVGRVGLSVDALPVVLPVNFVLAGDEIIFGTSEGKKARAARWETIVAFEADGWDPLGHTGWSVLVQGRARLLGSPGELERARSLPLRAWAGVTEPRYVAIRTDLVNGRRLAPAAEHSTPSPR